MELMVRDTEKTRDLIGGGDSGLNQERSLFAVSLVIGGCPKRGAVGHVGNRVGFDNSFADRIPPDLTWMPIDETFRHRGFRKLMYIKPLLDDLVGIGGMNRAIRTAMPYGKPWPRTSMV